MNFWIKNILSIPKGELNLSLAGKIAKTINKSKYMRKIKIS